MNDIKLRGMQEFDNSFWGKHPHLEVITGTFVLCAVLAVVVVLFSVIR